MTKVIVEIQTSKYSDQSIYKFAIYHDLAVFLAEDEVNHQYDFSDRIS